MLLNSLIVRMDSSGDGNFGSRRSKGHAHQGTDFLVTKGDKIKAPENGVLVRIAKPYASDNRFSGFVFKGVSGYEYKVFYVAPITSLIGKSVTKGKTIAIAQSISTKYSSAMKDHIHVEIRKGNKLFDPIKYFSAISKGGGFAWLFLLALGILATTITTSKNKSNG